MGLCFDALGENLAISRMDSTIQIFNLKQNAVTVTHEFTEQNVRSISYNPYEQGIWGIGDSSNDIVAWDYQQNTSKIVLPGAKILEGESHRTIGELSYLDSGKSIAITLGGNGKYGYVDVWDVARQEKLYRGEGFGMPVGKVCVSADGKWIAACGDGPPRMVHASTGQGSRRDYKIKSDYPYVFSANSEYAMAWRINENAGSGIGITIFDTRYGEGISTFEATKPLSIEAGQSAVSDDGKWIAIYRVGHGVQLFDAVTGTADHLIPLETSSSPVSMGFTTNPFRLIIAVREADKKFSEIYSWGMGEKKLYKPEWFGTPALANPQIVNIWKKSGYQFGVVPKTSSISLTKLNANNFFEVFNEFTDGQEFRENDRSSIMDVSSDLELFAANDSHNGIQIWNLGSNLNIIGLRGHQDSISALLFDGPKRLISTSNLSTKPNELTELKIWDIETGHSLLTLEVKESLHDIRLLSSSSGNRPNPMKGRLLLGVTDDQTIIVWDLGL